MGKSEKYKHQTVHGLWWYPPKETYEIYKVEANKCEENFKEEHSDRLDRFAGLEPRVQLELKWLFERRYSTKQTQKIWQGFEEGSGYSVGIEDYYVITKDDIKHFKLTGIKPGDVICGYIRPKATSLKVGAFTDKPKPNSQERIAKAADDLWNS